MSQTACVISNIAVLVNLRARRGSEMVARACRRGLPGAFVLASRSLDEAADFARKLASAPPSLFISGGGDGTTVALINALRGERAASAPIGCLRLGTGNAWARVTGAPGWRRAIDRLGHFSRGECELPTRRFDLVEVDGKLAHFAGTGWDAEIIDDFHGQKSGFGLLPDRWRGGLSGYLQGLVTRTIPRHLFSAAPVEVELINTGEDAIAVDEAGQAVPLAGGGAGAILYRGPVNVCAAGTSTDWGFGFRAFPFAGLVPRRFCMRIYAGSVVEATFRMRSLWRGAHPVPKMHTWMLTRCRARFSRPVPFQIGGDRVGWRDDVEYTLAAEHVNLLDWRRLAA
jgi:Diacylglycerol kinase catalytic domain